jgi:hypothetical protein
MSRSYPKRAIRRSKNATWPLSIRFRASSNENQSARSCPSPKRRDVGCHACNMTQPLRMLLISNALLILARDSRLFDFITDAGVTWNAMPDVYDVFVYPNLQVRACNSKTNFRTALIDAFPNERANIEQYFRDLKSAVRWFNRHVMAMAALVPLSNLVRAVNRLSAVLPLEVTRHYLERRFRDPRLPAVVTSQWADYGLPPGQSAFATHAVIATHYLNGAWYTCSTHRRRKRQGACAQFRAPVVFAFPDGDFHADCTVAFEKNAGDLVG